MSWEFDPQDVPLSRMLSNHSVEENRPGFFDLSTSDDIATRMLEYTQGPKQRSKNSLLNENRLKGTSSMSLPSTSQFLEPQHSHSAHSTNPIVTVTDWSDPLQAGESYEELDTPLTSARSSVSDSSHIPASLGNQSDLVDPRLKKDKHKQMSVCSDSLAEQDLEYDGKPPVLLDSQARSKQPVDIRRKTNFLMRILTHTKETVVNSLTRSAFHSLIRCLFAFIVISLLMIIPSTSRWIGPVDILTCSGLVFFPPIRTLGAQFEASVLGILFIMISCAYSYAALASLVAYNSQDNPQDYGAPLITAAFIIFATLVLGYLRTKYTRLYTPCVAAQVTLFFALFSNLRITELNFLIVWSVHKPLLLAVGITFLCSFFIFPQSATGKLADETQNALSLTSDLLENVSKTFLVAGDDIKLPEELEVTRLSLRSSLGSLNSVGREAMYELSVDRFAPWDYKWIGSTLTTVGQTLGSMLLLVFKEQAILPNDLHVPSSGSLVRNDTLVVQIRKNQDFSISDDRIYKALLNTVRDPVARIVRVCCRVIGHIQDQLKSKHSDSDTTGPNGKYGRTDVNTSLVNSSEVHSTIDELEHAIKEFDTTEVLCSHALKEMGLDTKPRDELFMVFTFLFCIREIARKLLKLAKFQKELCKLRVTKKRIWWPTVGIFTLLSAPRYDDIINTPEKDIDLVEQDSLAPSHNAEIHQHFRYRLWQFLVWFQNPEFKFSIKFTLALCLVAIPAFVSGTYDWFMQVHGNWGLVTVCLVMNQTVGSTISVGIYRIIGTIVGGFWGYLGWLASQGNPYIIAVFTYVIAFPCWYFFITKPQTKIPTVSLITYMVIIFSTYNAVVIQKQVSNTSALLLAVLRTANLIVAIIVSLLVEMLLWPYVARVELRKHLGRTFYNLGVLFSKTMSIYMMEKDSPVWLEARYDAKKLTSKLQSSIIKATALLTPATNEPRLRDSFQEQTYIDIISRVQNLLDWSSTMRASIVQIDDKLRVKLANPLVKRRKDVVAAVLLHFYVISGAFKSKSPLPPYLPSARVPRLRLLNKARKMDAFQNLGDRTQETGTNQAEEGFLYTFWYSYAGSMIEIVEEQEELGDLVKKVVGEIEFVVCEFSSNSDRTPTTSIDIERMADAVGLSVPRSTLIN